MRIKNPGLNRNPTETHSWWFWRRHRNPPTPVEREGKKEPVQQGRMGCTCRWLFRPMDRTSKPMTTLTEVWPCPEFAD